VEGKEVNPWTPTKTFALPRAARKKRTEGRTRATSVGEVEEKALGVERNADRKGKRIKSSLCLFHKPTRLFLGGEKQDMSRFVNGQKVPGSRSITRSGGQSRAAGIFEHGGAELDWNRGGEGEAERSETVWVFIER